MASSVLAFLCLFIFCFAVATGSPTLRLVNVVYRHGDRSPVGTFPTDIHQEDAWPQGWGQLTQLGMQMQYNVGEFLNRQYDSFLNASYMYRREEIYIRSTDVDRCLMSAESDLAGLYPPTPKQQFNPDIAWQPIPVHTIPKEEDYLLRTDDPPCPYYKELYRKVLEEDYAKQVNRENEDFFQMLQNKTGVTDKIDVNNCFTIEDPLFCEQAHNLTLVPWATPEVLLKLENLTNIGMTLLFSTKELARLKGGPLVGQMIQNMEKKSKNVTGDQMKLYMYSAHDTTLAAFLSALGLYNGKQSPYASVAGVELWEDGGNFSVKLWFRNSTTQDTPYDLVLPSCSSMCPLEKFKSLLDDVIPKDVEAECGATFKKNYTIAILVGTSLIVLMLFLILMFLICRSRQDKTKDGHVRLPQDPEV